MDKKKHTHYKDVRIVSLLLEKWVQYQKELHPGRKVSWRHELNFLQTQ